MAFLTRKRQKGMSLIEIIVSILLITIVMMSFAMVFPSGYRLSHKSRMESRATMIASGLLDKIMSLDFYQVDAYNPPAEVPTVDRLPKWDPSSGSTTRYKAYFEDFVTPPFRLPYKENVGGTEVKGIDVTLLDTGGGNTPTVARIKVTIVWDEVKKGATITKYVTVTGYRAANHDVRN